MKNRLIATAILLASASTAYAAPKGDIYAKGTDAYVIDQDNRVVRDNFGGCVRSINWSKETAIPACEGWPEKKAEAPKPAPVVIKQPAPMPVAVKQPAAKPAPVVVEKKPVETPFPVFRGLFKTNSAELNDESFGKLDLVVDYMKNHPAKRILVEGHTDSQGSEAHNKKLSLKRAEAVKNYLVSQGIAEDHIEVVGYGEAKPIADNATPEGRQLNRRVEIKLIK